MALSKSTEPLSTTQISEIVTKKSLQLKSILDQMAMFSLQFCVKDVFKDGKPRPYKEIAKVTSSS